jgi:hypothetical protein
MCRMILYKYRAFGSTYGLALGSRSREPLQSEYVRGEASAVIAVTASCGSATHLADPGQRCKITRLWAVYMGLYNFYTLSPPPLSRCGSSPDAETASEVAEHRGWQAFGEDVRELLGTGKRTRTSPRATFSRTK